MTQEVAFQDCWQDTEWANPGDPVRVDIGCACLHGSIDMLARDRNGRKILVQWLDGLTVREQWFNASQCTVRAPSARAPGFA